MQYVNTKSCAKCGERGQPTAFREASDSEGRFFFRNSDISSEFPNVTDTNLTRSVRHPVGAWCNKVHIHDVTSAAPSLRYLYSAGLFTEIKPRTLHLNTLRMILAVWLPSNRQKIVNKYHNDGKGGEEILIRRWGELRAVRPTQAVDIHAHILNTKTGYRTLYVNSSTASGETAATSPFTALSAIGCITSQAKWRSYNTCWTQRHEGGCSVKV